jgi:hypothetical protein
MKMGMFKSTSNGGGGIYTGNIAPINPNIISTWIDNSTNPALLKTYNKTTGIWDSTGSGGGTVGSGDAVVIVSGGSTGTNIPSTSTNTQTALNDLYGKVATTDTNVTELSNNKLNKVASPINTDLLVTDVNGIPIDSGVKITDIAKTIDLKTVAMSGLYSDLTGIPTIPTRLAELISDSSDRLVSDSDETFWNNKGNGDMTKEVYDINNDGIVNSASTLNGLTSTVIELNSLQGITGNVEDKFAAMAGAINLKDTPKATHAELLATTGMIKGDAYVVTIDESKSNNQTWYVWTSTSWMFMGTTSVVTRNFATNPLSLPTEVTGILPSTNIDTAIARISDINNIKGYLNYNIARTYNAIGKVAQETYTGDIIKTIVYDYFNNLSDYYMLVKTITIVEGKTTTTQTYSYQTGTKYLMTITTSVVISA